MSRDWKKVIRDSILDRGDKCRCGKDPVGVTCESGIWWAICSDCRNKKREESRKIVVPDKRPRIKRLLMKIDELEKELSKAKELIKEIRNDR